VRVGRAELLAEYRPAGFITTEIREEEIMKGSSCELFGAITGILIVDINSPARIGKSKSILPDSRSF
jgi:hypothetical protein